MGIDRSHGLDAITSERMVAGENVGPEALVRLLAAATAPPFSHETAGEDAAATAFRTARTWPVREGTPRPVAARRATLLGLKTAAAVTVAVAAAGAALAAGTGVLPNPFERPAPPTTPASTSSDPGSRTTGPTTPWGSTTGPGGGPPATVPANLFGLCQAWQAQEEKDPGKAAESPAFATLVTAAGGPEHVAEYCETLLGSEEAQGNPSKPPKPTQAATNNSGGQSRVSTPPGAGTR